MSGRPLQVPARAIGRGSLVPLIGFSGAVDCAFAGWWAITGETRLVRGGVEPSTLSGQGQPPTSRVILDLCRWSAPRATWPENSPGTTTPLVFGPQQLSETQRNGPDGWCLPSPWTGDKSSAFAGFEGLELSRELPDERGALATMGE
ncbi:hypothetical protein B0T16DRAFT_387351 [Cercophora newfieldiana]|uniref:Uncharacterized protein n=1 Tax=Cercophora newfieldiana TaxID=92897 RepID=A0AA39YIB0_9PEZI|nr:hypothetical protein B0T16DRAFT_387351 [Cercophora newfieldiana]